MDIIQLPTVPLTTPLRAALGIMRASHRSAVITQANAAVLMISARDVRLGINRDQKRIADLEGVETIPTGIVPMGFSPHFDLGVSTPLGAKHLRLDMSNFGPLMGVLTNVKGDYAIIGQIPGIAFILTRFETRAELYADPPLRCACGNPQHVHEYGDSDGVHSGDTCKVCGFPIDCD